MRRTVVGFQARFFLLVAIGGVSFSLRTISLTTLPAKANSKMRRTTLARAWFTVALSVFSSHASQHGRRLKFCGLPAAAAAFPPPQLPLPPSAFFLSPLFD